MKNALKILLVDDDFRNSMLLKRFIEAEGYETLYAGWDWKCIAARIPTLFFWT